MQNTTISNRNLIGYGVVLIIIVSLAIHDYSNSKKYEKDILNNQVKVLMDSAWVYKAKIDILNKKKDSLQTQIEILDSKLKMLNYKDIIKRKYEKSGDSIKHLNLDGEVEFLSKYLI